MDGWEGSSSQRQEQGQEHEQEQEWAQERKGTGATATLYGRLASFPSLLGSSGRYPYRALYISRVLTALLPSSRTLQKGQARLGG